MQKLKTVAASKPLNLIIFNFLWFGLVVGRNEMILLTLPVLTAYVGLLRYAGKINIYQIIIPASIGITIDCVLTLLGLFIFSEATSLIPIWLIALWVNFSTTLTMSLSFIGRSRLLAAGLGGLALPFNYAIGDRLGAVTFGDPYLTTVVVLALIWSISFPILFMVSNENFTKKLYPR